MHIAVSTEHRSISMFMFIVNSLNNTHWTSNGNLHSFLSNKQKPSKTEEDWICVKLLVSNINRAKKRTYANQFNELLTVKKKTGS
jgi:hypothetical protein